MPLSQKRPSNRAEVVAEIAGKIQGESGKTSRAELAKRMGVSNKTLQDIVNGKLGVPDIEERSSGGANRKVTVWAGIISKLANHFSIPVSRWADPLGLPIPSRESTRISCPLFEPFAGAKSPTGFYQRFADRLSWLLTGEKTEVKWWSEMSEAQLSLMSPDTGDALFLVLGHWPITKMEAAGVHFVPLPGIEIAVSAVWTTKKQTNVKSLAWEQITSAPTRQRIGGPLVLFVSEGDVAHDYFANNLAFGSRENEELAVLDTSIPFAIADQIEERIGKDRRHGVFYTFSSDVFQCGHVLDELDPNLGFSPIVNSKNQLRFCEHVALPVNSKLNERMDRLVNDVVYGRWVEETLRIWASLAVAVYRFAEQATNTELMLRKGGVRFFTRPGEDDLSRKFIDALKDEASASHYDIEVLREFFTL